MVMVLKEEENLSKYIGFCALNKVTIKDKFPIPFIGDVLHELHGADIFATFILDTTRLGWKRLLFQKQLSTHMKAFVSFW